MKKENFNISVVGLGHIGLPTALLFSKRGFNVTGVDIVEENVKNINSGKTKIVEPGLNELLKECIESKKFKATTDSLKAAKETNVMIVIVPTPVNENKESELGAVISASKTIAKGLKKGDLIVIESTVPPKTCENIVIPILEESGLKAGKDFNIAYTPERALPNNTLYEMTHNARVIGGINKESTDIAAYLYGNISEGKIIKVKNLMTAEMIKLMENTYRDTNIALANELALICEPLGIDAIEAIEAANYHPRVNIHTPGPGVGGHCLSIDPYFLIEMAKNTQHPSRIIKVAREINESMPYYVSELIEKTLKENDIKDATISILGISYKANVEDARETPAIPLIYDLLSKNYEVIANDQYVDDEFIESLGIKSVSLEEALESDCVVLITDHDEYKKIKPEMIKKSIFICTRPIFNPEEFREKNVIFKGIGRP